MSNEGSSINSDILRSIEARAEYDTLTEIYNRNAADANIREYLKTHPDDRAAIVMIEVTDIRYINEKYGHHIGDIILKAAAELIARYSGADSIIGRNSGAQFIVLIEESSGSEVESVIKRIDGAKRIVEHEGETYEYSFAIGYCLYPSHGILMHDLAAKAYTAMENSKAAGGGCMRYE